MISKSRIFLVTSPSNSTAQIPVVFYDQDEHWLIVIQNEAGIRPELPTLWREALNTLDEEPEYLEESVWKATAAQVEQLLKRIGIDEWFFTTPASSPMSEIVGVLRGEERRELAEVKSGSWSNNPYHSQWDDQYSYQLEKWIGPNVSAIRIQQNHRRGVQEEEVEERWFVQQADREWIEQSPPDLKDCHCIERL